jgi:hypothetical protein
MSSTWGFLAVTFMQFWQSLEGFFRFFEAQGRSDNIFFGFEACQDVYFQSQGVIEGGFCQFYQPIKKGSFESFERL